MTQRRGDDAIEIDHLTRTFRTRHGGETRAVDDLSLRVERGEMLGLLGPNGAGKTSTVKVLMTVLVFPAPLGPSRPSISPRSTRSDRSSTARVSPP